MRLIDAERRPREAEGLRIRALAASAGVSSHGGRESDAAMVSRQSKVTLSKWLALKRKKPARDHLQNALRLERSLSPFRKHPVHPRRERRPWLQAQTCEAVAASKRRMAFARHRTDLTSLQKATFRLPQDCGCGAQLDTGRAGPDQRHGERDRSPCVKTDGQLLLWNDTPHDHLIGCEPRRARRRTTHRLQPAGDFDRQRP